MIHCTFDTIEWISGRKAPPPPYPCSHSPISLKYFLYVRLKIWFTSRLFFQTFWSAYTLRLLREHFMLKFSNICALDFFIWFILSSSSILSTPPCIVNDNDRYKMKAHLSLVYFLWKRKPRTQIWKNLRFLRLYRAIMRGRFCTFRHSYDVLKIFNTHKYI